MPLAIISLSKVSCRFAHYKIRIRSRKNNNKDNKRQHQQQWGASSLSQFLNLIFDCFSGAWPKAKVVIVVAGLLADLMTRSKQRQNVNKAKQGTNNNNHNRNNHYS